jgi:hypothetical protein
VRVVRGEEGAGEECQENRLLVDLVREQEEDEGRVNLREWNPLIKEHPRSKL